MESKRAVRRGGCGADTNMKICRRPFSTRRWAPSPSPTASGGRARASSSSPRSTASPLLLHWWASSPLPPTAGGGRARAAVAHTPERWRALLCVACSPEQQRRVNGEHEALFGLDDFPDVGSSARTTPAPHLRASGPFELTRTTVRFGNVCTYKLAADEEIKLTEHQVHPATVACKARQLISTAGAHQAIAGHQHLHTTISTCQ